MRSSLTRCVSATTPGREIIEEHENYLVVRKSDGGGTVARALDPRKEGA
jgi:hypothetical protein